ncbi:MAG: hypothetical protein AAF696_10200 [Bacteroidota bacterium]
MKTVAFFLLLLFLSPTSLIHAQRNTSSFLGARHKNIYLELLGSHFIGGFNLDVRLKENQNHGLGFQVGAGFLPGPAARRDRSVGLAMLTFPMGVNTIIGKKRNGLLLGAGLTPIFSSKIAGGVFYDEDFEAVSFREGPGLLGAYAHVGYRHQALNNGFMFQLLWSPYWVKGLGIVPIWPSLGIGYGFK